MTSKMPTDEQLDERRSRYGRHLPVHPLRQSRVPAVLADEPEFRRLAAERQAVRDAEARVNREHAELTARNDLASARHAQAQREALLHGTPPPPPLQLEPWLYPQHTMQTFDDAHGVIEATEFGLLEEHLGRWADQVNAKVAPLRRKIDDTRQALAALEERAQPYEKALNDLQTLGERVTRRHAEDRQLLPTREEREDSLRRNASGEVARQIQADFDELNRPPTVRLRGRPLR